MGEAEGQARPWWRRKRWWVAETSKIYRCVVSGTAAVLVLNAGLLQAVTAVNAAQNVPAEAITQTEKTDKLASLQMDRIPWQDVHSLRDLEIRLESAAKALRSEKLVREYLKKSGLEVSKSIPISLIVMRHRGFE